MAAPPPSVPPSSPDRRSWLQRRRDQVRAEIERNRQGGHRVPTWVLTLVLVGFVAAWAAVIVLA